MSATKTAVRRQERINEKLLYQQKIEKWRRMKVHGDIITLAGLTNVSTVAISKAVNHGTGSLRTLRKVDEYFLEREKKLNSANEENK